MIRNASMKKSAHRYRLGRSNIPSTSTMLATCVALVLCQSALGAPSSDEEIQAVVIECEKLLASGDIVNESNRATIMGCEQFLQEVAALQKVTPATSSDTQQPQVQGVEQNVVNNAAVDNSQIQVNSANGADSHAEIDKPSWLSSASITRFLLSPKRMEFGMGVSYNRSDTTTNLLANRSRDLVVPLSFKIGITQSVEASLSIPFKNRDSETVTSDGVRTSGVNGMGDTNLTFIYQAKEGHAVLPDVSFSLSAGFPTGSTADPLRADKMGTGSGFRSYGLGIVFVKASDPAVLFGNFGYRYIGERSGEGYTVQPGATISYSFGAGFSVNQNLTFTTQIRGAMESDTRYNGRKIAGTSAEPISLTTGLDYQISRANRVESSMDFGLNEAGKGVGLSLHYIHSF